MTRMPPALNSKTRSIRCAIYTRKSSEEGLDQEFNSLHAQREACSAYITSQKHEGWELLPQQYDDGGFSGGNLDRPALKALLEDITNGQVDTVVVYKVDRLTRSLTDFARLVEVLDQHEVSFVSVTQQFNTTSSMGRLTLNVLLSFAQFEREVTGERIRDKIALSKKKGKWMGGLPPMGYDVVDKKLVVNPTEAEQIRYMFQRYLELGSVFRLKADCDDHGIRTKRRTYQNGRTSGGLPYCKNNLYHLLQNRVFIGEIIYKEDSYPGEHEAIIDKEVFDQVQELIAKNRLKKLGSTEAKRPCVLAGLIYDDCGNIMSPKYSNTRKRFYRYYTSQAIIQGNHHLAGSLPNIPADEIERLVRSELKAWLENPEKLQPLLSELHPEEQQNLIEKAKTVFAGDSAKERLFQRYVIEKIVVSNQDVEIALCADRMREAILGRMEKKRQITGHPVTLRKEIKLAATRNGSKVIVGNATTDQNAPLIKAITRSFYWNELLISGEVANRLELRKREQILSNRYIGNILRLRFLAPNIITAILDGTQPADWTVQKLFGVDALDWKTQRQLLGMESNLP